MPCVNLKKKTTVALLCLLSFIGGCLLSSQLSTSKVFARERGAGRQTAAEGLSKEIRDPLARDRWLENVTQLGQQGKGVIGRLQGGPERQDEAAVGRNETSLNEYIYGDNRDADAKGRRPPMMPAGGAERATKPTPRFDYLAEVRDPRAEVMLQRVVSKLPPALLRSVAKSGLLPGRYRAGPQPRPAFRTAQEKWAQLIATMQEQGYEQRLPTVLNIGVKKSGTNAFGFFMAQHPQMAHSIGNEVHYFDWNYNKGIEYYRSRMAFSDNNQVSFEKTPRYFVTESAPANILKDLPGETKFIVCVRDPVERARSDFRHEAELASRRGQKDRAVVRARADKETPASQGLLFERTVLEQSGRVNASNEIVRTSNYAEHFRRWLGTFPRDRFYILSDELLGKDIYAEMKNIEQFLGLEPFYKKSMFYYSTDTKAPCMHVKPRPCPAKSTPGFLPKAEPSSEVIQKLRDFYRPFNKEFEKLTQMRFSWTNL